MALCIQDHSIHHTVQASLVSRLSAFFTPESLVLFLTFSHTGTGLVEVLKSQNLGGDGMRGHVAKLCTQLSLPYVTARDK